MTFHRISLVAAILLGSTGLAGCGGDSSVPSASQARTAACRGYVLVIGDQDTSVGKQLMAEDGYVDVDSMDASLAPVRAAAVTAGAAEGLGDEDYELFRALTEAVDGVKSGVRNLDDGSQKLDSAAVGELETAVRAVHKRCY